MCVGVFRSPLICSKTTAHAHVANFYLAHTRLCFTQVSIMSLPARRTTKVNIRSCYHCGQLHPGSGFPDKKSSKSLPECNKSYLSCTKYSSWHLFALANAHTPPQMLQIYPGSLFTLHPSQKGPPNTSVIAYRNPLYPGILSDAKTGASCHPGI